jgi:hypothetical protein
MKACRFFRLAASARCSQARPSRASSLQLVTLNTSASMPSAASSCAAFTTSVRIAPEPISVTFCFALPEPDPAGA